MKNLVRKLVIMVVIVSCAPLNAMVHEGALITAPKREIFDGKTENEYALETGRIVGILAEKRNQADKPLWLDKDFLYWAEFYDEAQKSEISFMSKQKMKEIFEEFFGPEFHDPTTRIEFQHKVRTEWPRYLEEPTEHEVATKRRKYLEVPKEREVTIEWSTCLEEESTEHEEVSIERTSWWQQAKQTIGRNKCACMAAAATISGLITYSAYHVCNALTIFPLSYSWPIDVSTWSWR